MIMKRLRHLIFLAILVSIVNADSSQDDCQTNEMFVPCGFCEGTCKMPIIINCTAVCRPPRCECRAKHGYVRAHDGACIRLSECETYISPFKMDPRQLLTKPNVILKAKVPDHLPSYISPPGALMPTQQPSESNTTSEVPEGKTVKGMMNSVVDSDGPAAPSKHKHKHEEEKVDRPIKAQHSEDSESIEITAEELEKVQNTARVMSKAKVDIPVQKSHGVSHEDLTTEVSDTSLDTTHSTSSSQQKSKVKSGIGASGKSRNQKSRTEVKQGSSGNGHFPLDDSHVHDEHGDAHLQSQENPVSSIERSNGFGTFSDGPKQRPGSEKQPKSPAPPAGRARPNRPLGQESGSVDRSGMSVEIPVSSEGKERHGQSMTTTQGSRLHSSDIDGTYETSEMPLPPSPTYKARPISARPPAAGIHPPSPKPKKKSKSKRKHDHDHRNQHALTSAYPESGYILYPPNGYRIYRRRRFLRLKAPPKH